MFYVGYKYKVLVILQGMDISGKDGIVNDVFVVVNLQGICIVNFKGLMVIELVYDYFWCVYVQVLVVGEIVVFNCSYYEDVFIICVYDWIDDKECKCCYCQINDFECMLWEIGMVVLKFFLYILKVEQKLCL